MICDGNVEVAAMPRYSKLGWYDWRDEAEAGVGRRDDAMEL